MVSGDGLEVHVGALSDAPASSSISTATSSPALALTVPESLRCYSLSALPARHHSTYALLAAAVASLRARTPKVLLRLVSSNSTSSTIGSGDTAAVVVASFALMENGPLPDFRGVWADSTQLSYCLRTGKLVLTRASGRTRKWRLTGADVANTWPYSDSSSSSGSSSSARYVRAAQKALLRCLLAERCAYTCGARFPVQGSEALSGSAGEGPWGWCVDADTNGQCEEEDSAVAAAAVAKVFSLPEHYWQDAHGSSTAPPSSGSSSSAAQRNSSSSASSSASSSGSGAQQRQAGSSGADEAACSSLSDVSYSGGVTDGASQLTAEHHWSLQQQQRQQQLLHSSLTHAADDGLTEEQQQQMPLSHSEQRRATEAQCQQLQQQQQQQQQQPQEFSSTAATAVSAAAAVVPIAAEQSEQPLQQQQEQQQPTRSPSQLHATVPEIGTACRTRSGDLEVLFDDGHRVIVGRGATWLKWFEVGQTEPTEYPLTRQGGGGMPPGVKARMRYLPLFISTLQRAHAAAAAAATAPAAAAATAQA
jgi:hypothetical protein